MNNLKVTSKRIILYVILGILVLTLLVFTFFPGITYAIRDSGNSGGDICKPAPGYTEESWYEHMSHHPNIYRECLNR
jgi:hypothetical protein